jgi:hypothetical protein
MFFLRNFFRIEIAKLHRRWCFVSFKQRKTTISFVQTRNVGNEVAEIVFSCPRVKFEVSFERRRATTRLRKVRGAVSACWRKIPTQGTQFVIFDVISQLIRMRSCEFAKISGTLLWRSSRKCTTPNRLSIFIFTHISIYCFRNNKSKPFLFWLRRDIKYLFILIIVLAGEVKQDLQ